MRFRCFSLSKDDQYPNEDAFAECAEAGRFALSDGASSCYAGGTWASILTRRFAADPRVGLDWLLEARREFEAAALPGEDDWLGIGAYERGSFATFLGFTINDAGVDGYAIGDSVLFIQSATELRFAPSLEAKDFSLNPTLLSTHAGLGAFSDEQSAFEAAGFHFAREGGSWGGVRILAMTDALALTVLEADGEGRHAQLEELSSFEDQAAFERFVRSRIADGKLRMDDTTLLVVEP
jgi:hypothetical protein